MCFVRKALDWLFTHHELKWLDDIMPEAHKREKADKKKQMEEELAQQDVSNHGNYGEGEWLKWSEKTRVYKFSRIVYCHNTMYVANSQKRKFIIDLPY